MKKELIENIIEVTDEQMIENLMIALCSIYNRTVALNRSSLDKLFSQLKSETNTRYQISNSRIQPLLLAKDKHLSSCEIWMEEFESEYPQNSTMLNSKNLEELLQRLLDMFAYPYQLANDSPGNIFSMDSYSVKVDHYFHTWRRSSYTLFNSIPKVNLLNIDNTKQEFFFSYKDTKEGQYPCKSLVNN